MEFQRTIRKRRAINLTALIDVVFLLVVFFLLTTKFVTSDIVDLSVSKVEDGDSVVSEDEAILVFLTQGGKFTLSGEQYELNSLPKKIGELIKKNRDKNIVLISSDGVTVQDVVTAMDLIKAAGGYNISLADKS